MLFVFTHIYFTPEFLQSLLVDLVMTLYHVVWLLGVERVGDGAQHENIELKHSLAIEEGLSQNCLTESNPIQPRHVYLYSLFAFLLFAFLFLLQLGLCESLLAG